MHVLLVNTNRVEPPVAPIGLFYLAAFLRARGVSTGFLDVSWNGGSLGAREALTGIPMDTRSPDVIGFSVRNIDSAQMMRAQYFIPEVVSEVRAIRSAFPSAVCVLGGAGFSIEPVEILKLTGADFGIVGEGEAPFFELLGRIADAKDPSGIPGLVARAGETWAAAAPRCSPGEMLRSLPFQEVDAATYEPYYSNGGMASIQTKRGCAARCLYCTYPVIEGREYRLFPPNRVVDEMEHFARMGFDYFHFADSIFNVPRRHAIDVCEEIVRRQLRVRWHAYMSPAGMDAELAGLFARSGNDGIQLGVDSCSEAMLEVHRKSFSSQDIFQASRAVKAAGLDLALNILFGAPGETLQTVQETLDAVDELAPDAAFITQGIRVYRGTPIHRWLVERGQLSPERPLLEPYFYFSPELGPNISERIRSYAGVREFVFSDVTERPPSTNPDAVAVYRKNFRGPCWRILRELRKLERAGGKADQR